LTALPLILLNYYYYTITITIHVLLPPVLLLLLLRRLLLLLLLLLLLCQYQWLLHRNVKNRIVSVSFPVFKLGNATVQFVNEFRYLGHIITENHKDDDDIERETRNLFIRTNVLLRRFGKCSREVKLRLFKSYCMGFYDIALWKHYNAGTINHLKSAYIKCIKIFFGFSRRHSVTRFAYRVFDTILFNSRSKFESLWNSSHNNIVRLLSSLGL